MTINHIFLVHVKGTGDGAPFSIFATRYKKCILDYMDEKNNGKNGFQLVSKYRGAIMGIAALWILVFHAWVILSDGLQHSGFRLINFVEHFIKDIGFCGVDVFFFLSGIGLTFAIKKESLPKFYYRRIRRVALPALSIGIIRGIVQDWSLIDILCKISGFNFFMVNIYNFLWFVTAIIILYIFSPFYWKLFDKAHNKILFTVCAILIWLMIVLIVRDNIRIDLFAFINRIPVFLIGILIGYLTQNNRNVVFSAQTYIILILMLITGLYLEYQTNYLYDELIVPKGNSFLPTTLIAISLSFLTAKILDVIEHHFPRFGKAVVKTLGFFGMISLEMYCIQWWFADMVPLFVEDGIPKIIINIGVFILITATAWVSSVLFKYFWELVEKPFSYHKTV